MELQSEIQAKLQDTLKLEIKIMEGLVSDLQISQTSCEVMSEAINQFTDLLEQIVDADEDPYKFELN